LKKHYDIEELTLKNDSDSEQIRTRKIFEDLKDKAEKDKPLLEREKDFLCLGLKLTTIELDGKPGDYKACDNSTFKHLYLVYFSSNLGAEKFYKPHKGQLYVVPHNERLKDFKYLQRVCDKWIKEIEKTNHSDQILQSLASETREELKNHKKKSGKLYFRKQKEDYAMQREKHILHSKFIYLLVKQVIENTNPAEFEFDFLGETVEIDANSLIHIINRHYAAQVKNNPQKTYHIEDFEPEKIHRRLKELLSKISLKGIIKSSDIGKIAFIYNGVTYRVWINKRKKQIKGVGQIEVWRIDTFYPIEEQTELDDLNNNYDLMDIEPNLKAFVKK
tara:strand:+ start:119 stop:1114 length:996 start_codon:yes stop_codon:yes gene_type:complete